MSSKCGPVIRTVFLILTATLVKLSVGHWVENNIIGPTCAGNIVEYSNLPEYDQVIKDCDGEVGHCRPLCILSKLGMMNADGYFVAAKSKPILQFVLPPVKNRFRATELTGAYESCSMSFNFNDNLNIKDGCASYSPLLDCFRKSSLMICEGVKGPNITDEIGNAAVPWPKSFTEQADTNPIHNPNPTPPIIPEEELSHPPIQIQQTPTGQFASGGNTAYQQQQQIIPQDYYGRLPNQGSQGVRPFNTIPQTQNYPIQNQRQFSPPRQYGAQIPSPPTPPINYPNPQQPSLNPVPPQPQFQPRPPHIHQNYRGEAPQNQIMANPQGLTGPNNNFPQNQNFGPRPISNFPRSGPQNYEPSYKNLPPMNQNQPQKNQGQFQVPQQPRIPPQPPIPNNIPPKGQIGQQGPPPQFQNAPRFNYIPGQSSPNGR